MNCMAKCMCTWLPAVHDFVERAEIVLPYDWRIRIITMCLPAPATISWSVRELYVHMGHIIYGKLLAINCGCQLGPRNRGQSASVTCLLLFFCQIMLQELLEEDDQLLYSEEIHHDGNCEKVKENSSNFESDSGADIESPTNEFVHPPEEKLTEVEMTDNYLTVENESLILSKVNLNVSYKVPFFMKMVLKRQLPSLGPVNRPSGTEFRPGDEVFLCPKGRPLAQGKQFIIYGFFQENKKHPTYTTVMLIDEDVWGEYQKDPNPENGLLENLFRACPVKFVGHTPNGRHVDSTGLC